MNDATEVRQSAGNLDSAPFVSEADERKLALKVVWVVVAAAVAVADVSCQLSVMVAATG